jgi:uncharacterized protein (DUF433 family)
MTTEVPVRPVEETVTPILGEYIVSTPGTCNGEPRIAGTRIKVRHIYNWVEQQGLSVAQVVEQYPHLTRSAVHAALAYYWSHADEIQKAIDDEDHRVAGMKAAQGPSLLARKQAPQP